MIKINLEFFTDVHLICSFSLIITEFHYAALKKLRVRAKILSPTGEILTLPSHPLTGVTFEKPCFMIILYCVSLNITG
jgi:hypothetical protein